MGRRRLEMDQIGPSRYLGDLQFGMAGEWQLVFNVDLPDGQLFSTSVILDAPAGALDRERLRHIDFAGITYTKGRTITFLIGLMAAMIAVWLVWQSRVGRFRPMVTAAGLTVLAGGGAMMLSVTLVEGYPTTFWKNPKPYTMETIHQAQKLTASYCAVCHGPDGRGDGPAAATLESLPADLHDDHIDDHTDGELWYWITFGIRGSAMPGFKETLSDDERWALVTLIRSYREGKPEN
jgi:mono/diheme cytochrome c family protein